jgi:putative transport protein
MYRNGCVNVPADDSVIHLGDVVRLVGPKTKLLEFERVIGRKSTIDLKTVPSELTTERLYVTKRSVLGRSLRELNFEQLYGAIVTRVTRAEVEFAA